jgi:hypothetical protein
MLNQRFSEKVGYGQSMRFAVLPALMYLILFYSSVWCIVFEANMNLLNSHYFSVASVAANFTVILSVTQSELSNLF